MTKEGDVAIAFIRFPERVGGKRRPVLIVQVNAKECLVLTITSQYQNKSAQIKRQFYPIREWKKAGLRKQSYVDIKEVTRIMCDRLEIIGHLSAVDYSSLITFIRDYYE
ncbi:type II toxin-antitoxin system PemK/MazF family toxin [Ligilactobacillus sp. LYQ139]|uniref:type II toxin-antitoxin system PemK/MazF family toxin n=1 Tax=Ligilactobacillus sp. LYQ139 TaxID=3378800 RepID=UPI0038549B30